ncbi:MAG: radical SAM family heme chaperone HemW [Sumerlaeia bacterium]
MTLGLYLHVPFCKHHCPYCDFYVLELRDRSSRERLEYPGLLAREHLLLLDAEAGLAARPLETIYFGGGTPSTLRPADVAELIALLRSRHPASPAEPEVTLEANPENLTPERAAKWRAAGIDRLSIGVQSFAERDLARLERLHAPETIHRAVANARAAGFGNLSLDLMFALPGQDMAAWRENLRAAVALAPEHVSFYGLTLHEGTPFHREAEAGVLTLPKDDEQAEMYLWGSEFLRGAGFEHYEISNFARPGFRSRHNQRYWTRADVVGCGPGAHSSLGARRWSVPEDLTGWQQALAADALYRTAPEELSPEVAMEEALFCGLRREEGFREGESPAAERFFSWLDSPAGKAAVREGFVVREGEVARLTPRGWLVSDGLLLAILKANSRT